MTVGEKIKQRRLELGLSQDELARRCGYKSRSSVNKIELARDLPLRKIELMAKALDVTPGYLMGWEPALTYNSSIGEIVVKVRKDPDLQRLVKEFVLLSGPQREGVLHLVHSLLPDAHLSQSHEDNQ